VVPYPEGLVIRIVLTCLLLLPACLFAQDGAPAAEEVPVAGTDATTYVPPASLEALLAALPDASLPEKGQIINGLEAEGSPAAHRALRGLLNGLLYVRSSDRRIVAAEAEADPLRTTDVLTGEALDAQPASQFSRITLNNQLRRALRGLVATLDLASEDTAIRLAAVKEMLRSMDEPSAALLRQRLGTETDATVRREMEIALALVDAGSPDAAVRLAAVKTLDGSLHPEVYNRLSALVEPGEDGRPAETDPAVLEAARTALRDIEGSRKLYRTVETLFFGLSLGSVLVLAGIGLAITFGVMGVINMAHGELMMLGAYSVYVVQQLLPDAIGSSLLVAIPVAFLVSGLVGVLIERGVVRFLYGRPLETLLATFGISLILQQLVRDIFSPNNRPVQTPEWMAGSWQVNEVLAITWSRIYIIVFAALVFVALLMVLKRTRLGLHVRAVAQNRAMARAMGIRTDWVDAMTFGLGAGIAGVAGVALSQLTNVGPNLGQSYIVDSFMVVVFGGVGNLWGTLISGLSLGVVNKLLEPFAGAVLGKVLVLVALILFIQRRPRGLFPQKGRAAEG
jgi:urea transport system permease protein